MDQHHFKAAIVRDPDGQIVCLKVPISMQHIEILEETDTYVNNLPFHEHKRGLYEHRHWTCWWDFNADTESRQRGKVKQLIVSSEYKRDQRITLPPAVDANQNPMPDNIPDRWFYQNRKLFSAIGNILRLWMPDAWIHLNSAVPPKFLRKARVPHLAPPYIGLAMNRKQKKDGQPHLDFNDDGQAPNAIVPYGVNWTGGGDLLLHPMGIKMRVYKGEVCFFYGRWCTHNVVDIEGERNVLDLLMNGRVKKWAQRQSAYWDLRGKNSGEWIDDDDMEDKDGVAVHIADDADDSGDDEDDLDYEE